MKHTKTGLWVLSSLMVMLAVISTIPPGVMGAERSAVIYKDHDGDVLADSRKGPLTRLMDLRNLDGTKADDFQESPNVDISALKIMEDDTYAYYLINVNGKVISDRNYTYYVCGYTRVDPDSTQTFDFILTYSNGQSSYEVWEEGSYRNRGNISSCRLDGPTINMTMNRNLFILGSRSDPYFICAIVVMSPGEGQDRYIDYVLTGDNKDKSGTGLDQTSWMVIQVAFIGILVITTLMVWNFWAKKKGMEQEGGVCPKCEGRLNKNLDFCPYCGTYIRGPNVEGKIPPPKIVSPLDTESEE